MRWRSGVSGADSFLSSQFMVLKVNKCLKAKKNIPHLFASIKPEFTGLGRGFRKELSTVMEGWGNSGEQHLGQGNRWASEELIGRGRRW